jgi:hypothetical protein
MMEHDDWLSLACAAEVNVQEVALLIWLEAREAVGKADVTAAPKASIETTDERILKYCPINRLTKECKMRLARTKGTKRMNKKNGLTRRKQLTTWHTLYKEERSE